MIDWKKRVCNCKYRKDGSLLGLCLRCFNMQVETHQEAKQEAIKELVDRAKEQKMVAGQYEFSRGYNAAINDLEELAQEIMGDKNA